MALFKISKGASGKINDQALGDGYCWFTYDDGKFYIDYKDPADNVVKRKALNANNADHDHLGNLINSSYAANLTFNNSTYVLTLLAKSGATLATVNLIDYKLTGALNGNTYTYTLTPFQNNTALTSAVTSATIPSMSAASAQIAGAAGLVPAPQAGAQDKFLRGDGTWVDLFSAYDAMVFKGVLDSSGNTFGSILTVPAADYSAGWTYRVAYAGEYAGEYCEVGDLIIAVKDYQIGAASNADWAKIEHNIDGALFMYHGGSALSDGTKLLNVTGGGVVTTSSSTVGSSTHPVFLNAGTLTETTYSLEADISASGFANRMAYYSDTDVISAANHFTDPTHVGINYTGSNAPNENLYVYGTSRFAIGDNDNTSDKRFIIGSSGREYLSFGGLGIQAYDENDDVSQLYLNHNGGIVSAGSGGFTTGNITIGGGASGTVEGKTIASSSTLYLKAEKASIIFANKQTVDNADVEVLLARFDTHGYFRPETDGGNQLGSSSYRWSKLFVGTANSYGSTTQPIYWYNGVPTAITGAIENDTTGNAATADKVNKDLVIKIKTGTTEGTDLYTFNGSAAKTLDIKQGTGITLTAAAGSLTIGHSNSVTASTAGTSSATSGVTLAVPYVTYDAQGHITGSGTHTHTVPAMTASANGVGRITAGTNIGVSYSSGNVTVTNSAVDTLTGSPAASKTITAFDQVNGAVSATFADIAISGSQVTLGTASVAVVTDANKKLSTQDLTVSSPTASGTGIDYIATISQSATGKITATKSTVRSASTSQTGVLQFTAENTNAQLNTLTTGSSTPVDADYYISQYVGGGTTTTTYHRRPMSALWDYIKGHITNDLYWANIKVQDSSKTDTVPTFKTIYFGTTDPTENGRGILTYSSSYPNHGLWYFNDSTDTITLDAHGKANSKAEADLMISGAGIIYTRNRYIPHTGNTTGTVGDARKPVYVNAGTITAGEVTFDTLTKNRLMWTSDTNKPYAGYHYANSTQIAVNATAVPSEQNNYNFYVVGNTYFKHSGASNARPIISGTRTATHLSIGNAGFQAYDNNTASTLFLNYYGGQVDIGSSSSTTTDQRNFYGGFDFKTTGGFTYSGIEAAGTANAYRPIWFASATSSTNIIKGKPSYDDNFTYNPVENSLHIVHANGKSQEFRVSYSNTVDMSMMIGTGNINHGLYDHIAGKWMIVADSSGNVTVNGNATSATKVTQLASVSTDAAYRILLSTSASDAEEQGSLKKDTDLRWNPSTNTLDIAASNSGGILKTSVGTLTINAASTMYISNPNSTSIVFTTDSTTTGEYARFNSKGNLILDDYTSTVNNITYKLYVNGTSYFKGKMTLHNEGTTAENVATGIIFSNKDTTSGKTYNTAYIYGYQDHYSGTATNGLNFVIKPGGALFIGSGESPESMYRVLKPNDADTETQIKNENIYVTSDENIYLYAKANTIANRTGVVLNASGHIIPQKAGDDNSDAQNLGSTTSRWQNIYASRTVNVENAGEATIILNNTTKNHKIEVVSGASGNAGLYDMTKGFYFINTDQTNGETTVQSYTNQSIYFKQNGTTIAEIKSNGLYVGLTTDTIERDIVARSDLGTISIFQHGSGDTAKSHGIWATSTTSGASAVGLYWLQDNSILRSSTTIDIVSTPSNRYKYLTFSQSSSPNSLAGFIRYDSGHKTNISAGQFSFHEYSPQSTATTTSTGHKEIYVLPNVTAGLADDVTYSILTTKNKVTIAQGGTDATTRADAFTNIVAPGGQMTGPLSWKNSTALPEKTSPQHFLVIDAFADGGKTYWTSTANAIKSLVGSSAIGSNTLPVYWTGTGFSATDYPVHYVSQSETTTSYWRKVLLSYQSGSSGAAITANTNVTYTSAALEYQPSTGTLKATKFQGPLTGNATTATTLQTARTIQTNLASTSAASFNGSANITPGVTGTLPIANGGTGGTTASEARTNLGAAPAPRHIYADSAVSSTRFYYVPLDVTAASSNIWITGDIWINNYTNTSYITPGRVTFSFVWTSSGAFSSGYYTDTGSSLGSFELVASPADETTGNRTLYLKLKHTARYQRFYITAYSSGTVTKNIALAGTTTAPTIDSEKTFTMIRKGPVLVAGTSSNTNYYLVGVTGANATTSAYHLHKAYNGSGSANTAGVYFNGSSGVLYGAAWNDYAEYRETKEEIKPGCCVKEIGDDTLELTTNRLERGCEIVSDTYGFAIGETNKSKTPIAASGRVLAYPYESREEFASHIGWPVCSGPNGTVSIMTEEEEEKYPSRIIGTISAVPDYEEWGTGNVKVNGRVWIRIR